MSAFLGKDSQPRSIWIAVLFVVVFGGFGLFWYQMEQVHNKSIITNSDIESLYKKHQILNKDLLILNRKLDRWIERFYKVEEETTIKDKYVVYYKIITSSKGIFYGTSVGHKSIYIDNYGEKRVWLSFIHKDSGIRAYIYDDDVKVYPIIEKLESGN